METGTEKVEQEENNAINKVDLNENNKVVEIASPLKGEVLPLNEVKDEAFASGILGNGGGNGIFFGIKCKNSRAFCAKVRLFSVIPPWAVRRPWAVWAG